MKKVGISQKDILTLIILLLLTNVLPLADIFIHQVAIPVESVNFFGILVNGCFIFDLGLVLTRIVINILIICFWITGLKKRD
ncbi:MAG: hypothetical protein ACTSUK_07190 [Promethearchaeota archaeon]